MQLKFMVIAYSSTAHTFFNVQVEASEIRLAADRAYEKFSQNEKVGEYSITQILLIDAMFNELK